MLDTLLKLTSIHEVRKKLKANDIRGERAKTLESEWLSAKEEEETIDIVNISVEDAPAESVAEVEISEEVDIDITPTSGDYQSTSVEEPTTSKKPFRARKFSK